MTGEETAGPVSTVSWSFDYTTELSAAIARDASGRVVAEHIVSEREVVAYAERLRETVARRADTGEQDPVDAYAILREVLAEGRGQ